MDNINVTVGTNIKSLREHSGLTQSHIAKFLNIDQSMVSKIEKGDRLLTSDMLQKLASLFAVTTEDLLSSSMPLSKLSFAFRSKDITVDDLETISAISTIALNSSFMTELLNKHQANG